MGKRGRTFSAGSAEAAIRSEVQSSSRGHPLGLRGLLYRPGGEASPGAEEEDSKRQGGASVA
eukprot:9854957-Heterocapsa_arctica.AAC.1